MTINNIWPRICKQLLFSALLLAFSIFSLTACAQVPKQAVELSATVGRDIAQVYQSHKELAILLYERIKKDVNNFVDNVYAPYQTKKQLKDDYDDFKSGDEDSLFAVLNYAVNHPDDSRAQINTLEYMETFLEVVREDIESFRQMQLSLVIKQEQKLLSAIDRSYNQIHYANSIVTGHLSSIVKVHEVQNEILDEIGVDRDLRTDIGTSLSQISGEISNIVDKAEMADGKMEEIETAAESLKSAFDTMKMKLSGEAEKE